MNILSQVCGECKLFVNEDSFGNGWCEFHQKNAFCENRACEDGEEKECGFLLPYVENLKEQINWKAYSKNLAASLSNEKIWSLGNGDEYNPHLSNVQNIENEIKCIAEEDYQDIIDMHSDTPDYFKDFLIKNE